MSVKKLNDNNGIQFTDFSKLHRTFEYDKEKVELMAEAANEAAKLTKRLEYLQSVAKENEDLTPFLWRTAEGEVLALHKIEDDHLKNIITHITRNGGKVKPEIIAEARSRGINPDEHMTAALRITARAYEGDDEYEEIDREF